MVLQYQLAYHNGPQAVKLMPVRQQRIDAGSVVPINFKLQGYSVAGVVVDSIMLGTSSHWNDLPAYAK